MRSFFFFLGCLLCWLFPACGTDTILVSIAPQKWLVQKLAGPAIQVEVLVPSGASPHSYEPSLKQMTRAVDAKIWFRTGEGFEKKAVSALEPHLLVVDLREGIHLLPSSCCHHDHDVDAFDSHIWLSTTSLITQAQTIAKNLVKIFPFLTSQVNANLQSLTKELTNLDLQVKNFLSKCPRKTILVSHPAFGYYCRDYGLKQLSIEVEGKDPSSKQVISLIEEAKQSKIDRVFVQPQYSQKAAGKVAHLIGARVEMIDPYQENPMDCIRLITSLITR